MSGHTMVSGTIPLGEHEYSVTMIEGVRYTVVRAKSVSRLPCVLGAM